MIPVNLETTPAKTFQELLERYSAIAYDRQSDLAEVIGSNAWNFDMAAGTISFGPQLVFPVQVLGSFSKSSRTWLWGWANEQSGIPAPLLAQAQQLRTYGEQQAIDQLRTSSFDATETDLHLLAFIAAGMFDASGYYLADYGQGVLVVTIKSEQIDRVRKNDVARLLTTFPQVISFIELQHRPAFMHYATLKGFILTDLGDEVTATAGPAHLTATFDDQGRLSNLRCSSGS